MNFQIGHRLISAFLLAVAAMISCLDGYVHVLGNQIISAGHAAHSPTYSCILLDPQPFGVTRFWVPCLVGLSIGFFLSSLSSVRGMIQSFRGTATSPPEQ